MKSLSRNLVASRFVLASLTLLAVNLAGCTLIDPHALPQASQQQYLGKGAINLQLTDFGVSTSSPVITPNAISSGNLIADGNFQSASSPFFVVNSGDSAVVSNVAPIAGTSSLSVSLAGTSNDQLVALGSLSQVPYMNGAEAFDAQATLRNNGNSPIALQFCAGAAYSDWELHIRCSVVALAENGSAGSTATAFATVPLSSSKLVVQYLILVYPASSSPALFSMDDVTGQIMYVPAAGATPAPAPSQTATPVPAPSQTATPVPAPSQTATPVPAPSLTATPGPGPSAIPVSGSFLTITPSSAAFGNVTVGNSSSITLTVSNSGSASATLGTVSAASLGLSGPFSLTGGTCTTLGTVAAATGPCTLVVTYTPSSPTASSLPLTLSYAFGGSSAISSEVIASGVGVAPASLAFSPASAAFGNVTIGNSSSITLTVTNSGATIARLGTVSTVGLGLSAPFSLSSGGTCVSLGYVAPVNGSCTLVLTYTPAPSSTISTASSQSLSLSYDRGTGSSVSVNAAASGVGVTPASLAIAPMGAAFGNVTIGNSSSITLTVSNSGGVSTMLGTVNAGTLGLSAPYSLTGGTCPTIGTLAAATSCTLIVTYTPTSAGSTDLPLSLSYSKGTGSTASAAASVSGTGVTPASLAIAPAGAAFGNVTIGNSSSISLTVSNSGGTNAGLGTVSAASLGLLAPFSATGGSCLTIGTLTPSGSCILIVTYTPSSAVASSQPFALSYSKGTGSAATVTAAVSGTGITPASLAISLAGSGSSGGAVLTALTVFGDVAIGSSAPATFTVTNSGGTNAMLNAVSTTGLGLLAPFSLTSGGTCATNGILVAGTGSCTLIVTYAPDAITYSSQTLTLSYNNGTTTAASVTAAVTGIGVPLGTYPVVNPAFQADISGNVLAFAGSELLNPPTETDGSILLDFRQAQRYDIPTSTAGANIGGQYGTVTYGSGQYSYFDMPSNPAAVSAVFAAVQGVTVQFPDNPCGAAYTGFSCSPLAPAPTAGLSNFLHRMAYAPTPYMSPDMVLLVPQTANPNYLYEAYPIYLPTQLAYLLNMGTFWIGSSTSGYFSLVGGALNSKILLPVAPGAGAPNCLVGLGGVTGGNSFCSMAIQVSSTAANAPFGVARINSLANTLDELGNAGVIFSDPYSATTGGAAIGNAIAYPDSTGLNTFINGCASTTVPITSLHDLIIVNYYTVTTSVSKYSSSTEGYYTGMELSVLSATAQYLATSSALLSSTGVIFASPDFTGVSYDLYSFFDSRASGLSGGVPTTGCP